MGGGWVGGGACGQPEPGSGCSPAAPPCLDPAAGLKKAISFPVASGRLRIVLSASSPSVTVPAVCPLGASASTGRRPVCSIKELLFRGAL